MRREQHAIGSGRCRMDNIYLIHYRYCFSTILDDQLLIGYYQTRSCRYDQAMQTEGYIAEARRELGDRIRLLRKAQDLSQYRFSAMIGMDRSYLIGIEKGRRNVSVDNLVRIAAGLDVSLSSLFEGITIDYQGACEQSDADQTPPGPAEDDSAEDDGREDDSAEDGGLML